MKATTTSLRRLIVTRTCWLAVFCCLAAGVAPGQHVEITEVGRSKGVTDEENATTDWIELYNLEPVPVNLKGWQLLSSQSTPFPLVFPNLWMDPGAFLVVYASEKNRVEPDAPIHAPYKLPSDKKVTLSLLRPDSTLSSTVFMTKSDAGVSHARLMTGTRTLGDWANLGAATPGTPNWQAGLLVPAVPSSSVPAGIHFTRALTVALATEPEAEIRYTLDGSNPNATSPLYTQPLTLTRTTLVRARARFRADTGEVLSGSGDYRFVLADPDLATFSSDLPLLLLTGGDPGPGHAGDTLQGTITLLDNNCARNSPSGLPAYLGSMRASPAARQEDAASPRQSLNIVLTDANHQPLPASLSGMPPESRWRLLRPHVDATFLAEVLAMELDEAMGHYAPRRRIVELFLSPDGSPITYSNHYAGIGVLIETPTVRPGRLAISTGTTASDQRTGFLLEPPVASESRPTVTTLGRPGAGLIAQSFQVANPYGIGVSQLDVLTNYLNGIESRLASLFVTDGPPAPPYPDLVDRRGWVDFQLLAELGRPRRGIQDGVRVILEPGAGNALDLNARQEALRPAPPWDWFGSFGSLDGTNRTDGAGWVLGEARAGAAVWIQWLLGLAPGGNRGADADFWQQSRDRWGELRAGPLSDMSLRARIGQLAGSIAEGAARDFASFPHAQGIAGASPPGSHAEAVQALEEWIMRRTSWLDAQLVGPGQVTTPPSGDLVQGDLVALQAARGVVYYTLDGSDPRAPGGGIAAVARRYTGPFPLTGSAHLVVRALDGATWGIPTSTFLHVPAPLRITEILYHPQDPPFGSPYGNQGDFQFVELQNTGPYPLPLGGMRFTQGILFTFPDITLPAGARTLVVSRQAAFESRYGTNLPVAGEFEANSALSTEGETLELIDAIGMTIQRFDYIDRWYPLTDGPGLSLVASDVNQPPEAWSSRRGWHASRRIGGSPGQAEPAPDAISAVVINEVLSKSDPPDDAIELFNPTGTEADIGGWFLTDNYDIPWKFRFPAGTRIPPYGFLVLDEYSSFNSPDLENPFGLSDGGESVFLYSADTAGRLTGYVHGFTFGAASVNTGFARYVTAEGDEFVAPQSYVADYGGRVSWWETNAPPDAIPVGLNPTLALTELMTDPSVFGGFTNSSSEFIEIRNIGTTNLDMTGARFTRGVVFTFPQVILRPGDYAVVVQNRTTFTNRYGTGIAIVGEYSGFLSGSGETLKLEGARGEPVLEFSYDGSWYPITRLNWGPERDFSLVLRDERTVPQAYGTAGAWRPSSYPGGSPGEADPDPVDGGVPRLNEVLVSADHRLESVELHNPANRAVDVGDWLILSDAGPPGSPGTYVIPPHSVLPPNGYLVVHPGTPLVGNQITLVAADSTGRMIGNLETFTLPGRYQTEVGYGRYPSGLGPGEVVAELAPTFGLENGSIASGPVVISEIFHHPPSPVQLGDCLSTDDTFIELHNRTAETVPLFDPVRRSRVWQLGGGVSFRFTSPTGQIPAGGYALVVGFDPRETFRLEAFRRRLGVPAGVPVFGPYEGSVARDSGTVELLRPSSDLSSGQIDVVERVDYAAAPPWPEGTAGGGASLQRVRNQAYADDPASWTGAPPTPGRGLEQAEGPRFVVQPSDIQAGESEAVEFTAAGTGTAPLVYQWLYNGQPITGANQPHLRIDKVSLLDQGTYVCVLVNASDAVASVAVQLRVIPGPVVIALPAPTTVPWGAPARLSVVASSTLALPVCSLFVDGVLVGQTAGLFDTPESGFLELAGAPGGVLGSMDELSVYSRALSPAEVSALHAAGARGKAVPLHLEHRVPSPGILRLRWEPRSGVRLERAATVTSPAWQPVASGAVAGQAEVPSDGPFTVFRLREETDSLPPPAGLVAWWPGEGTGADLAGSNPLTPGRGGFAPGVVGQAFQFNGPEDAVRAQLGPLPSRNADRTIEFWLRATPLGNTNGTLLSFVQDPNAASAGSLILSQGDLVWLLPQQRLLRTPLSADTWHHIALTVAGDLTYQWKRDGIAIPGATLRVLELPAVDAARTGNYSVVVSNGWGSVETSPAAVRLGEVPTITEQPADVLGSPQGPPVLECLATSSLAPISYHWFKSGAPDPVASAPVFTVSGLAPGQSASFWCQVSNVVGAVTSRVAQVRIPGLPEILRQPVSTNALVGATVSFEVVATTTDGGLRYEWLRNSVVIPGATSPALTLTGITIASAGSYRVRVITPYGTNTSQTAVLGVGAPPRITLEPAGRAVIPGDRVDLVCQALSVGFGAGYRWFHDARPIAGPSGPSLAVRVDGAGALGDYFCVVTNPVGSVTSQVATLIAKDTLPHILTQPLSRTVVAGDTVQFSVEAATFGDALRFQWLRNGTPVVGATNAVWTLEKTTVGDEGFYAVRVSNIQGSVLSLDAVLTLRSPPTVLAPATVPRVTVVPGDLLLLAARVNGGFPMWSQWVRVSPDGTTSQLVNHVLTNGMDTFRTLATPASAGLYGLTLSNSLTTNTAVIWPVAQVTVGTDLDGDLVDDSWEAAHALDPLNPADAADDPDRDGFSNRSEYAAGTDPWDRDSRLEIETVRPAGNQLILEFQALSNRTYIVEWRPPTESRWHALTYVPAETFSRRERVTDGLGTTGRLYRVSLPSPVDRP